MISNKFWLIYGLRVLQKGLKIGPSDCIQMSKTCDLLRPLDPSQGPYVGRLDPTPIYSPLATP